MHYSTQILQYSLAAGASACSGSPCSPGSYGYAGMGGLRSVLNSIEGQRSVLNGIEFLAHRLRTLLYQRSWNKRVEF